MKRILSLVMLICAFACNKAMAEVQIFVHIPVESTGNLDPEKAPYVWSQDETFGAYPGQKMTNNCKVNDVMYFYATIPNVSSATFKINNGDPVEKDNCTEQKQVSAASGSENLNKYYFWDIDAPTQLTEYYPTKVYVGAPLTKNDDNTWTDPSADDNVYVWFDDVVNSDLTHGVCGTDNYPEMPGVKVSNLPVEEIFGVKRHYFIYKHHTDNSPVLKFTDGNATPTVETAAIPVQDGYLYTYACEVDGDNNITAITAAAGKEVMLEINETNFPDANFRKYIDDNYDVTSNNKLTSREINDIRYISIPSKGITNLKGLEFFTQVRTLDVSENSIGANGLSMLEELPNLLILKAKKCGLTNIPLNHPNLQVVYIDNNKDLVDVDFSKCPSLRELTASGCSNLEALNLTKCNGLEIVNFQACKKLANLLNGKATKLVDGEEVPIVSPLKDKANMKDLNISDCGIDDNFDFSGYKQLEKLAAFGSNFTNKDFTDPTVLPCFNTLTFIHLQTSHVQAFPFSSYPNLQYVYFYQNDLETADFTGCNQLIEIGVHSNKLNMDKLDLTASKNTLKKVSCDYNYNIRSIDVTNCNVLEELNCHFNALEELDVTTCTALKKLNCNSQRRNGERSLDDIDLTNNVVLQELSCASNNFRSLNVSNSAATLQLLDARDNYLQHDDFVYTGCNNIRKLYVNINPDLKDVDIEGMTYLNTYYCGDTGISTLNVSSRNYLQELNCMNTPTLSELILNKPYYEGSNLVSAGLKKLNCSNCSLSTLDLRGNPVNEEFRINDNRFTDFDLTNYDISRHEKWYYNVLGPQYPVLPAVVVVENDENEDDIVFYYTIELPASFDETKAKIDSQFAGQVTLVKDAETHKTYFKIPRGKMNTLINNSRDYHFMYTYEIPLNENTPVYQDRHIVKEYVKIIYPASKYEFSGEHHSSFNASNGRNEYANIVTLKPIMTNMLESDLGVIYKLKRFKLQTTVDVSTENIRHDENVASMILEKINPSGDFVESNLQWRIMEGDTDNVADPKFSAPMRMEDSYELTDELSYAIDGVIDWKLYCYNVVRDLNGDLFYVPVYSGTTQAEYVKHTFQDILDDTDHTLGLPSLANVNVEHEVEGASLTYIVNGAAACEADGNGQLATTPSEEIANNTVHGLINTSGVDSKGNVYTNTYGAKPAKLQTYFLEANADGLGKSDYTFNENGRHYWYNLGIQLGDKDAKAECVGFRVWQTLPEEDRDDYYEVLKERTNDFCIFDNVKEENSDLSVTGIGTDVIMQEIDGVNRFFWPTRFGSKNDNTVLKLTVRAYYRVTEGEGPAPTPAPSKAGATPAGQYLVAEQILPVDFSSIPAIPTAVDEVLSEIPVMVRYLDLNGRVSDRPFGGATMKIITHANGKVTKQLLK